MQRENCSISNIQKDILTGMRILLIFFGREDKRHCVQRSKMVRINHTFDSNGMLIVIRVGVCVVVWVCVFSVEIHLKRIIMIFIHIA